MVKILQLTIVSLVLCINVTLGFKIFNWDVGQTVNDIKRVVTDSAKDVGKLVPNIGNVATDTVTWAQPWNPPNRGPSNGLEVIVFVTYDWWWHGWIQVGDTLYNFSKDGVGTRPAGSGLADLKHRFEVGRTGKSQDRFNQWVHNGRFTEDTYNVATNNCNHFVRAACKFLGLTCPVYSPIGFK